MRKNEMALLEELKKLNEAIKQLSDSKEDISDEAIEAVRSEQARLHEFINMPEADFNRLYDVPNADVVSFAETMNVKEVECRVIEDRAIEDAIDLTKTQMDCIDAINILTPEQEELPADFDFNAERSITIAEHPIRYAIQCLKDTIADISDAKTSLYESGISYKNYKQQAADAVMSAGNTAYRGIVAPIQSMSIDIIESATEKAKNVWQKTCNAFHAVKEKICSVVNDKIIAPIKNKAKSISEKVNNIRTSILDTRVAIHNYGKDFCIDALTGLIDCMNDISSDISTRAIRYAKAGNEIAKTEEQLKSEIDALLGTETYKPQEHVQNPAITAQIEAIKQMLPNDSATAIMVQQKEKLLAKEEKAWNKQEARIAKTDEKLVGKLVKDTKKDLRKTERIHHKADVRLERAAKGLDKLEFIKTRLNAKAIDIAQTKWQVIPNDKGRATIDKGVRKEAEDMELA